MTNSYTNRLGKLSMRATIWISSCMLFGCANTGTRIGAESPIAALGSPTMVQTSLGRLAVWDSGDHSSGPAVALWPSIFTDHVIYSSLVQHWRGKRRLILIDGPGHGSSEGPREKTFSMQECAIALKEILDSKSIQSVVAGGTSWGGLVAGEFAILYPQNTRAVIMLNTPFYATQGGASMGEKLITWGSGFLLGTDLFTNGVARSFFLPATREAGGQVMAHFHRGLHQSDSRALSTAIRSVLIERKALADQLPQIQAPALIVAGLRDGMYPIEMQREAVKQLSLGKLEVIDSQHISVVDRPAEVAKMLDTFLDSLAESQK